MQPCSGLLNASILALSKIAVALHDVPSSATRSHVRAISLGFVIQIQIGSDGPRKSAGVEAAARMICGTIRSTQIALIKRPSFSFWCSGSGGFLSIPFWSPSFAIPNSVRRTNRLARPPQGVLINRVPTGCEATLASNSARPRRSRFRPSAPVGLQRPCPSATSRPRGWRIMCEGPGVESSLSRRWPPGFGRPLACSAYRTNQISIVLIGRLLPCRYIRKERLPP